MKPSLPRHARLGIACAALLASLRAEAPLALAQPAPRDAPPEAPAASAPDAKREASERFQRGVRFHRDGEYEAALIEFKRAHELSPNYRVLFNLGQTSRELRDHAGALRYFERFLAEGGKEIEPWRRRDVEQWIEELRPKVGRVAVTTAPPGAQITVDDVVVGTTPLPEHLVLNAGRRKIHAARSGHLPVQRYVDVAGAEEATVALELTPLPPPAPPPAGAAPAPPPAPRDEGASPLPWIGLATTGALAIGWGVLGIRALAAQSDFEDELDRRTTADAIDDARADAEGFALAADIVGGVALASAALTVVAFAVDAGEGPRAAAPAALRIGPGYLGLTGRF